MSLKFKLPAPRQIEEVIELLNATVISNTLSLTKEQDGLLRLATGDQYILETYQEGELYAFLLGMFLVEYRGDDLARIEEQARFNRAEAQAQAAHFSDDNTEIYNG